VAHQIQDDGFHEIQLNGKQLVFLFMAATVVSVVIFLCGVLVGRGVRAERSVADSTTVAPVADPAPAPSATTAAAPPADSDPTKAAPPATDELSYFSRLEKANTPQEQLKAAAAEPKAPAAREKTASTAGKTPPPEKVAASRPEPAAAPPAQPPSTQPAPAAAPAPASAPKEPERTAPAEAAPAAAGGDGFAVQIAALNVRSEADAIAKRLSSKGYAAYVLSPAGGTPSVYRVRVGKFPTRREAESVAARLQREEQFKPWVTR
jgi:cell division septation protein DedD